MLLAASAALAQPAAFAERCSPVPASAGSIGKRDMGLGTAAVMGFQGAAWREREREERGGEKRTDLPLRMVAAGAGAGIGQLSQRMVPAVMPGGKVRAVDVQPEVISLLQAGVKRSGLPPIEARLGAVDHFRLPFGSVDLVAMADVHHDLALATQGSPGRSLPTSATRRATKA